jgi:[CysO sulfur-carrier protein]-S-L-cysteine hydrolase
MRIAQALLDEVIEHARRDAPNECCGVVAVRDGEAVAVHPMLSTQPSPLRFELDGLKLFTLLDELEDAGLALGAIYHSHTRSAPRPSQTDINFGKRWPGVEWLIVGLAGAEPEVRSWLIADDGVVSEVVLHDDD